MKHNYYITHFALHEAACARVSKQVWDDALKYLKATNDADDWKVMLYGA